MSLMADIFFQHQEAGEDDEMTCFECCIILMNQPIVDVLLTPESLSPRNLPFHTIYLSHQWSHIPLSFSGHRYRVNKKANF